MTSSTSSGAVPFRRVGVAVLDVALGRDAAQAVVAHQSLLSVGLQHAAHEQQCAGRRVLDGPGEGPVEDEVEVGFGGSATARVVTAVVGGGARARLVDVDAGALQDRG